MTIKAHQIDVADLAADLDVTVTWTDVTGKPTTFAPSAHTHVIGDVTGLQAALDGKLTIVNNGTLQLGDSSGGYDLRVAASSASTPVLTLRRGTDNTSQTQLSWNGTDFILAPSTGGGGQIRADTLTFRNQVGNTTRGTVTSTAVTWTIPVNVPSEAYGASWSGSTQVPTKGDLYTKIQSMGSGGGGTDPWTYVYQPADVATSGVTGVDVTGLGFTPAANKKYEVKGVLMLTSATLATGPQPGLRLPTGLVHGVGFVGMATSLTGRAVAYVSPTDNSTYTTGGGTPRTSHTLMADVSSYFQTGASPSGTFQVLLRSEVDTSEVIMKAGSWIAYREMP